MAATATTAATTKLIQFRSICLPGATVGSVSVKCFSSSSSNPDHNEDSPQTNSFPPPLPPPPPPPSTPTPKSPSLYSSLFSDVKATLKQQQGNLQSQPSRISRPSFNFSNKEEIERNLSEFRRRSAVPPPPSDGSFTQQNKQLSFAEIYQRNEASTGEDSSSASSKSVGRSALKSISESLKFLRTKTGNNASERFAKNKDSMSLSRFRESLKMKPGDLSGRDSTNLIGGSDNLPMSVFGKEMQEGDKASGDADTGGEYVRPYNHKDMGEKLKSLRPDRKGDWFSLQELNNRLMKLRQIDKEEADPSSGIYGTLRGSLIQINKADKQMKQMPNLDILRHLGRTPSFMMLPPQEQLIAKYFHPDNMSASEKLKLDLMKVRDEFKMSESDCGSARVQVAQLTTKIKHLASVLHKKDKHSKKGLLGMVQKRKTLLKYLRRTDWESYSFVLSKLGLRDNPDYKK